jgi:tetratricopeptide (TPR) repeat protein
VRQTLLEVAEASREAAERQARLRFGGVDRHVESHRDVRGTRWVEDGVADLRYAVRALLRTPAFTVSAVLVLALGIGTSTAIFSAVNTVMLAGLPYEDDDRLVRIYNDQKKFDLAAEAGGKAAALSASAGGGGSAEAMYNNGVVLFNAAKFAEAKTQFESATKADPSMALAHYYLGMANLNGGDLAGATAAFDAYLKLDPDGAKMPANSTLKIADLKAFVASQKK